MADTGAVAELDRRFSRLGGWIPPPVVEQLVASGHVEAVRRHAAHGDWHCAHALARLEATGGDVDAGADRLAPFAATGWWRAVRALADLLAGRVDEAVAVVRPLAEAGDRLALGRLATLLAGQGHLDEAVTLLRPHVADSLLARALVRLQRSDGRPIAQPSALDVEAHVQRLGSGLDYLILDRDGQNYLQAAAGGRFDIPAGVFWVERREGGPDLHFRCAVDTVGEVAEIFRGYLADQDGWGDRDWEQIWL